MTNRLIKTQTFTYFPAVSEVIGRAAFCTTQRTQTSGSSGIGGGSGKGGSPDYGYYTYGGPGESYITKIPYATQKSPQSFTVCYPAVRAVAGVDEHVDASSNPGWNSGAVSKRFVSGDAVASFHAPQNPVGVACGLGKTSSPSGSLASITHGLYITDAGIRPVESGALRDLITNDPGYAEGMQILRIGTQVSYIVGDLVVISAVPSAGRVSLFAELYAAGDYIESPSLSEIDSVSIVTGWDWLAAESAELFSARARWDWNTRSMSPAAWGWKTAVGVSQITGGPVSARWDWHGRAAGNSGEALLGIDMACRGSDLPVGEMRAEVADFVVSGSGGFPVVSYGGGVISISMAMLATGTKVGVGGAYMSMEVALAAADEGGYANGRLTIGDTGMTVSGVSMPNRAGLYDDAQLVAAVDAYIFDPVLFGVINYEVGVGLVFDAMLSIDALLSDAIGIVDEYDFNALITALIADGLGFSDDVNYLRRELLQYATNLATGAVTNYSNFGFLGFASTDGGAYGWKVDGIYRIGGRSDNGDLLSAMVEYAADDMGTNQQKRISNLYLGMATDGTVLVRLEADNGDQYVYQAISQGDMYRASAGKGSNSRHWRLRVDITEASNIDIDSIEWVAGASGRRLMRQKK